MKLQIEFNPALATLPVYLPGRPIEEVARELGISANTIIKLASNENPLGPSPSTVKAVRQAARQMHLYPDGNSFYLKQKLAEKTGRRYRQYRLRQRFQRIARISRARPSGPWA